MKHLLLLGGSMVFLAVIRGLGMVSYFEMLIIALIMGAVSELILNSNGKRG
jgi:hypothetical protein